jgi:hypothetical protein
VKQMLAAKSIVFFTYFLFLDKNEKERKTEKFLVFRTGLSRDRIAVLCFENSKQSQNRLTLTQILQLFRTVPIKVRYRTYLKVLIYGIKIN